MTADKTIYLIDGSAYIYRSFHALPPLTNSKGLQTNAVLGFTNILTKLIKDKKPEYLAMFFDSKGPTFRHEIFSEYKATRPPMPEELVHQLPLVRQVSQGYNVKSYEKQGYEADDLMGTAARLSENQGFSVVIVSGDKDFMQLVTDKIHMYDPVKDVMIGPSDVKEKTGVLPEKIIEIMALTGDSSDNVPGVPGIGKKTAPTLIEKFGSLEGLYEDIDTITAKKQKEKLIANKDLAFLSRTLVTIDTAADMGFDIEDCRKVEPDRDTLHELFTDLEFRRYQNEFTKEEKPPETTYRSILDKESLTALIAELEAAEVVTMDTETTSLSPMRAELVGLSFSIKAHEAVYIPCAHDYPNVPDHLDRETVVSMLKGLLENPAIKKVGQNIKYDMIVLKRHGIDVKGVFFDTMIASYVLNPAKRAHGMDQLAMELFNHKTISFEEVAGKGKNALVFSKVPLDKAVPYACEDADITHRIYEVYKKELDELGLRSLFDTVEMPLMHVLARIEMTGIKADEAVLKNLSDTFDAEIKELEEAIYTAAGETFNIKSSQQLGHILFEKLALPVQKKTKKKTGYSTDVDVLTALADKHELPGLVLRFRTLAKLKSTYTDALIDMIHPETGRIHTSFNQTVAVTGRLSSSEPNLQNIPIRTEEGRLIRSAFVPEPGHVMVSADYSQIELRLLAHVSDDPILIQAFNKNEDIHTRTAAEVFDFHPSLITSELRRQAKAINFGIVYGMSPYGLSRELSISQKMAKTYIDNYFKRYSGVKRYMEEAVSEAKDTGRTSTLLGRIRALPEIKSSNAQIRQFGERSAINTPIQGTAADLIKLAMIKINERIEAEDLSVRMLLSVHDEIVFEVPEDVVEQSSAMIREIMEHIWDLNVPLSVNVEAGANWSEAH